MKLNGTDVKQSHDTEQDDVSNNNAELEELVANALPNSQISHQYVEPHHLRDLELDPLNDTVKENIGTLKTEFNKVHRSNSLNSQDLSSSKNHKDDTSGQDYSYSHRPSDETEQMEISHLINCRELPLFERGTIQSRNDTSLSELNLDYKLNHRFVPTSYTSNHMLTSQNKYRLCFTSDLSESSSEEQDQDVYKVDNYSNAMSDLSVPSREHSYTDRSENPLSIKTPHLLYERTDVHKTIPEAVTRPDLGDTKTQCARVEQSWHKSTSLNDGLSFSEDFEDIDYPVHQNSSDSLSDSLSINERISSPCSVHPLSANREEHILQHNTMVTQCHVRSHLKLDHSSSPLHAMSVVDLKNLHQLLKSRMEGKTRATLHLDV